MELSEIILDFLEDARDQVDRFENALISLDQNPEDKTLISVVFRAAHSLKGSSYYTGFQHLGRFLHKLESLFEPIAKGERKIEKSNIEALFLAIDFVKQSLKTIQESGEDIPVPQELEQRIEKALSQVEQPFSEVPDLTHFDIQPITGEDSDPELFSIFINTVYEQLKTVSESLSSSQILDIKDQKESIDRAFNRLVNSSRYMDYDFLVEFFSNWQRRLNDLLDRESNDELIEVFNSYIEHLSKILPSLNVSSVKIEKIEPAETVPLIIDQELKAIEEEIKTAFSSWMEESEALEEKISEEIETHGETVFTEASVEEEYKEEGPAERALWEEIVEGEIPSPVIYKEEITVPDEVVPQPTEMLRVDPAKVDHLLNQVGELVIRRSHFVLLTSELKKLSEDWFHKGFIDTERKKILDRIWQEYRDATSLLGRITADLQDAVMKIRMLPLMQLFQRFPRVVRDHAAQYGKSVKMVIKGGETEVDRRILEQLYEPMIHILRNAVSHGIETPDVRKSKGKPEDGTITINAYYRGQHVIIEITDDGAGIPLDRLKKVLAEKGIFRPEEMSKMSVEDLLDTIFLPGVSTAFEVDESAGRGIGLDVVREECRKINGHVTVKSWEGEGTQFVIQIPLTLAIIPGLLVKIRENIYTLPLASVGEVYAFDKRKVKKVHDAYFLMLEDRTIPLIFPEYLFPRRLKTERTEGHYVVILRTPAKEAALVVDQFLGQQEVVIKPIEDVMDVIKGYAGATILGDGTISLIIDVPAMIDFAEKLHLPIA